MILLSPEINTMLYHANGAAKKKYSLKKLLGYHTIWSQETDDAESFQATDATDASTITVIGWGIHDK